MEDKLPTGRNYFIEFDLNKTILKKIICGLKAQKLSRSEIELVLLTLCGYNDREVAEIRFTCVKASKGLKTEATSKLGQFGRNGIFKYIFNLLFPELKNEILIHLYPERKIDLKHFLDKLGE